MVRIWLDDWTREPTEGGSLYRCRFTLEPLDWCARYRLKVNASGSLAVWLRGTRLAEGDAPLVVDVTDYVTLDDNLLELRLQGDGEITPGAVRLHAVPCEDA